VVFVVYAVDSVTVNGAPRRRINCLNGTYSCGPLPFSYIEGVGSDRHVLDPFMLQTYEISYLLACFKRNDAFHYSAFPAPPLCDMATLGIGDRALSGAPLTVYQQHDMLVVNAPGVQRVRLIDSWGRVVHEHTLADGSARIAVQWPSGVYRVQGMSAQGPKGRAVPVVLVR
jgi:hypothetical protein